jgi:methylmalonyl-CoA/ethylmalonyl-CoA epimerase
MSFTRVHHVGLVTEDLEIARHVLCDGFGLSVDEHRTPWPQGKQRDSDGATVVEFPIGEMYYEVACPSDEESDAAVFLAGTKGRGGMHYISIASDDMSADLQRLNEHGIKLKNSWDGQSPVFLDPTTSLGLSLQIIPEDQYYVHPYYRGNGVLTGMAHIGIAARSVDEIRQFLGETFGLKEDLSTERKLEPNDSGAADDPVHLVEFPLGGTVLEISVPTTDESGTARLVAQRAQLGAVFHHTCPFAPDVQRFVEQAVSAGLQQIGTVPPREERTRVVGWLHPRSCLGMLIEIWNRPPGTGHHHHL